MSFTFMLFCDVIVVVYVCKNSCCNLLSKRLAVCENISTKMGEEKKQFDFSLGGTEELPSTLTVSNFAAYRMQEIQVLKSSLSAKRGTKLAFQTLPKHMRRRAMSHNVKRLPRRLRQIHTNQMKKSGLPAKQKRPSRKYRRRPNNLVEEYTKRSGKPFRWLSTHIWHAKRFHMIEKWGYKIPCHPRDKAFKACYRASTQHCLVQDISYMSCIEIRGPRAEIIEHMKKIQRPNTGLTLRAKAFENGSREGEIFLFEVEPPKSVIGKVSFQWRPYSPDRARSALWIWVHPALHDTVFHTIIKCLSLILNNSDIDKPFYANVNTNISVFDLKMKLGRIRLTGPLANIILQEAFVPLNMENSTVEAEKQSWLKTYLDDKYNKRASVDQITYWSSIKNILVSELSPHHIVSLLVKDPRLNLPKQRTKAVPEFGQSNFSVLNEFNGDPSIASSALWDEPLRDLASESRLTIAKIDVTRSNLLVPGSNLEETADVVPIILVQRPGKKSDNIGLGSGWDLIVPSQWVKAFWISIIMRGGRAGGLRESDSILFEMGRSQLLSPDSKAGKLEETRISKEYTDTYFRRPPNKRTNFNKLRITSPFRLNWPMLVGEWSPYETKSEEKFEVLRDLGALSGIQNFLNRKANVLPKIPDNCLIPVSLKCDQKGSLKPFAIICLAKNKNDLKKGTVEPVCEDVNEEERKITREAHDKLLKSMRKRRKKKLDHKFSDVHKNVLSSYTKKMHALWLPEATSIRNSCSREIIGMVQKGGFSFSQGKSCATGYITGGALAALLKSPNRNKVLVRNTNSRQYRVANLKIIVD